VKTPLPVQVGTTLDRDADVYYVWRRNDGYVAASVGRMPTRWVGDDGSVTTFEELGQYTDWNLAYRRILDENAARPYQAY
jgi:hypothetical protein